MTKEGSTIRGLSNSTSITAKTEVMEFSRDSSLHNNDKNSNQNNRSTTTGINKSNEMLKANTASHINNTDDNGTRGTKHAKQLPGNKQQQNTTTTTLNNIALIHCENPTHTIKKLHPTQKIWSNF
jgi:hypothetical protein